MGTECPNWMDDSLLGSQRKQEDTCTDTTLYIEQAARENQSIHLIRSAEGGSYANGPPMDNNFTERSQQ